MKQRSLGGEAAVLAVGAACVQAVTLVSLVVLTRVVDKPALGGYQQLWLIYGILSPFLLAGLPTALLFFLPRASSSEEAGRWLLDSYLIVACAGVVSSLGVLLMRHPIAAALNDPALARALAFFAPYLFFALLTAALPNALVAVGRAALASALNGLNGVLTVAFVVAAAVISPTASSMAIGLSLSAVTMTLISVACAARAFAFHRPFSVRFANWRPLLAYGLPLGLTQLAAMLGFQFDRLLVSNRYLPGQYAVYAIGAVEVPIAIVVQQAVNTVLVPALARLHADGDLAGLVRQWQSALRKVSLVVLPLFAFLMVTAGDLISLLYGSSFEGSVRIFRAYLFLMPLRMAAYGLITAAIGRTAINLSASIVMFGANVALAIALVIPFGILGPAISTPLAMLVTVVFYVVRLRGVLALRVDQLLPWRLLTINAAVAFVAVIPAIALLAVPMSPFARLAASFAIFAPAYLAALRVTGRLTAAEWRTLLDVRRLRFAPTSAPRLPGDPTAAGSSR